MIKRNINIRNLKEALNHELVFKRLHRVIKFNPKASFKPYIDLHAKGKKKTKNGFGKKKFKLVNHAVFRKIMKSVKKHKDIKLVTTEARQSYLLSEPNYHTTKFFF